VYDPKAEPYLPTPYGVLPLSKNLGSKEVHPIAPLSTWETNVGYDEFLTPSGFLGSALFGGGESFSKSQIELELPKDKFLDYEMTVTLWFRSGDVAGRKTLIVRS
jgi:hypothetical protein